MKNKYGICFLVLSLVWTAGVVACGSGTATPNADVITAAATTRPLTASAWPTTTNASAPAVTSTISPPSAGTPQQPVVSLTLPPSDGMLVINVNASGGFDPLLLLIKIDTTVEFVNVDQVAASIVCDYPFTATIPPGGTFYFTFITPEIYTYWDQAMPNSAGTVIVSS